MQTISDIYIIGDIIGKGAYGSVYNGYDKKEKKEIALKIEKNKDNRLKYEYKLYKYLRANNVKHIPDIYDYVKTNEVSLLSMELLGDSLDKIFIKNNKKMEIGVIFKIGLICIDIMKEIHDCGIIHRDIKPHNFVINKNKDKLFIIDFGLAKKYFDSNKQHLGLKIDNEITGTLKYVSINVHMGLEPSRRDDLESLGYMLVYFAKGVLPWELSKDVNKKNIELSKICTPTSTLCKGLPRCFEEYLEYCKNLKFTDIPDYDKLKSLFVNDAENLNIVISEKLIN